MGSSELTSVDERMWGMRAVAAAIRWNAELGLEIPRTRVVFEFAAFLGDPCNNADRKERERHFVVNILNPEIRNKIDKILGPHGHTILKMMKAQQDGQD